MYISFKESLKYKEKKIKGGAKMTDMHSLSVMSISVDHRKNSAPRVQEILTQNGDLILGRFGMHDPRQESTGLITVNLSGQKNRINNLMDQLSGLDGVKVNHMET